MFSVPYQVCVGLLVGVGSNFNILSLKCVHLANQDILGAQGVHNFTLKDLIHLEP